LNSAEEGIQESVCGKLGVESRSSWPVADAVPCGVNGKSGCRTLAEN